MNQFPKNSKDKAPSFPFYPSDWLGDPKLRIASEEARGVWADLLCHMTNSDEYGYLIFGEQILGEKGIQKLSQVSPKKFRRVWSELTTLKIIKKDERGVYFSKRLVNDFRLRQIRKAAGQQGGNPHLLNQNNNQIPKDIAKEVNQTPNQNPTPSITSPNSYSLSNNPLTPKGAEEEKLKFDAEKNLINWFSKMEDVSSAIGLAKKYLTLYPPRIILSALQNSNCINRAKFIEIANYKVKTSQKNS